MTLVRVPKDKLNGAHRNLLTPGKPVPKDMLDRYFAQTPPGLNMFKLLMGFYLIAAFLALGIEKFIHHGDTTNKTILLVLGLILFAAAMIIDRRHKAAGGNADHRGAFVLVEGLLVWDGKQASFLAREDITGFVTGAVAGEYKQEYIYASYRKDGGEDVLRDWGFPTVGLTAALQKEMAEKWLETGEFSLHAYQHVSTPTEE